VTTCPRKKVCDVHYYSWWYNNFGGCNVSKDYSLWTALEHSRQLIAALYVHCSSLAVIELRSYCHVLKQICTVHCHLYLVAVPSHLSQSVAANLWPDLVSWPKALVCSYEELYLLTGVHFHLTIVCWEQISIW
jgi:hypothetical protein